MRLCGRVIRLESGARLGRGTVLRQSVEHPLIHEKPVARLRVVSGIVKKIQQGKMAMPDTCRDSGFPPRRLDLSVKQTVRREPDCIQDPGADRQKSPRWIEGINDFGWGRDGRQLALHAVFFDQGRPVGSVQRGGCGSGLARLNKISVVDIGPEQPQAGMGIHQLAKPAQPAGVAFQHQGVGLDINKEFSE